MKKLFIFSILALAGLFLTNASANAYYLDNSAIDLMFAEAEVVDLLEMNAPFAETGMTGLVLEQKDPVVAFLLAWFLGPLGIHRAYLGTSTGTIVGYILTLGGCGIIAFVDWVMLLIGLVNNDISQYVDNPRFFMW